MNILGRLARAFDTGEWKEEEHKRDADGRFSKTSGGLPELANATEKSLVKPLNNHSKPAILKLPDVQIFRTLGAKARNYDVEDKATGKTYRLVEGSRIKDVQVFAGAGVSKSLHEGVAEGLTKQYGIGSSDTWQHVKGIGSLDYNGEEVKAEIHWFQVKGTGDKVGFKIKEWLWDET